MLHLNTFCYQCGLYNTAKSPVLMGRGDETPDILFLSDIPTINEDTQGQTFTGELSRELETNIALVNLCGLTYRFEYAVKCKPVKESKDKLGNTLLSSRVPTIKEINFCKPHTIKLILKYKPKVIITLGPIPFNQLVKTDVSHNLARGRAYLHPQFNCYIIPTHHPLVLLKSHDYQHKKEFMDDLQLAKKLAKQGLPRPIVKKPASLKDPLEIKSYIDKLKTVTEFSCDLETTGLNHRMDRITDINLCCELGCGTHIDWQLAIPFYEDIKNIMEDANIKKYFHNGKFDIKMLRAIGIFVKNYAFDTMTGYHTLTMSFEGEGKGLYSLKNISWILTNEGGYETIMDEFGGISKYQQVKYKPETVTSKKRSKKIDLITIDVKDVDNPIIETNTAEETTEEISVNVEPSIIEPTIVTTRVIEKPIIEKPKVMVRQPIYDSTSLFDCNTSEKSNQVSQDILDKFSHIPVQQDTSLISQYADNAQKRLQERDAKKALAQLLLAEREKRREEFLAQKSAKALVKKEPKIYARKDVVKKEIKNYPIPIDTSLEEELQLCDAYVDNYIQQEIDSYNLTPLEYYSAMDADVTLRCAYKIQAELNKNPKQQWLYDNLIMPLSNVLIRMEENGLLLDFDHMRKIREDNINDCDKLAKKLYAKAGYEFNIDSPDDLRHFIYDHLKIPVDSKYMTAGGKSGNKKPSTDVDAIEHFAKKYPILKHIVEYRKLQKETSTYIDGWINLADPNTHRVYPSFLQHTTATGRLSSANPNAQNVPRADKIRNMIIAPEGSKLISCDLSQAELRILALISQDQKMLEAFNSGMDFHAITACSMFKIDPKTFNKEDSQHSKYRNIAKTINFGIAYGRGPMSIAEQINISMQEAQTFIDIFFKTYRQAKQWMEDTQAFALKHGYVETLHGRRRYLPSIFSSNDNIRSRAMRQAINTPIQGTASDCACFGLIKMQDYLDNHLELKSLIVGIIHDEILIESPNNEIDIITSVLPGFMTVDIPYITIPLEADYKITQKWSK